MIIFSDVSTVVDDRARLALFHRFIPLPIINTLVHNKIHPIQNNAISGYAVSLGDLHYVTNHEIMNRNRGSGSVGASVYDYCLIVDLIFQLEQLAFLDPVASGTEQACEHQANINCQRFNIAIVIRILTEERKEQIDCGGPSQANDVRVLKLAEKDRLECLVPRDGQLVRAESSAATLHVLCVAEDTIERISV